jgi:hypothetical protein
MVVSCAVDETVSFLVPYLGFGVGSACLRVRASAC